MVRNATYGKKADGAMGCESGAGAGGEWVVRESFLRKKDEEDLSRKSAGKERIEVEGREHVLSPRKIGAWSFGKTERPGFPQNLEHNDQVI